MESLLQHLLIQAQKLQRCVDNLKSQSDSLNNILSAIDSAQIKTKNIRLTEEVGSPDNGQPFAEVTEVVDDSNESSDVERFILSDSEHDDDDLVNGFLWTREKENMLKEILSRRTFTPKQLAMFFGCDEKLMNRKIITLGVVLETPRSSGKQDTEEESSQEVGKEESTSQLKESSTTIREIKKETKSFDFSKNFSKPKFNSMAEEDNLIDLSLPISASTEQKVKKETKETRQCPDKEEIKVVSSIKEQDREDSKVPKEKPPHEKPRTHVKRKHSPEITPDKPKIENNESPHKKKKLAKETVMRPRLSSAEIPVNKSNSEECQSNGSASLESSGRKQTVSLKLTFNKWSQFRLLKILNKSENDHYFCVWENTNTRERIKTWAPNEFMMINYRRKVFGFERYNKKKAVAMDDDEGLDQSIVCEAFEGAFIKEGRIKVELKWMFYTLENNTVEDVNTISTKFPQKIALYANFLRTLKVDQFHSLTKKGFKKHESSVIRLYKALQKRHKCFRTNSVIPILALHCEINSSDIMHILQTGGLL